MAKSKNNQMGLIMNIIIIVLAVLTICTLFMPIMKSAYLVADNETLVTTAKGWDCFSAAFAGEASSEMSEGANLLYGMRTAEEGGFVATVMIWTYMLTVIVAAASLVFAILNILGMRFKLVNTILGVALVVLALLAFIFALVNAGENTELTELANKMHGPKTTALVAAYLMFAGLATGGLQVYRARSK